MLTVENLNKTFQVQILGNKRIAGCRDVSFSVAPGQFLPLPGRAVKGRVPC